MELFQELFSRKEHQNQLKMPKVSKSRNKFGQLTDASFQPIFTTEFIDKRTYQQHTFLQRCNFTFLWCSWAFLMTYTIYAKKNGTLWKKVDLLWLDQCKFIPLTYLISFVFCMTLPRLHDRLHPPWHWFIQLVEVVAHYASTDLFVDGWNYNDPFPPS